MSTTASISLIRVRREIADCQEACKANGWTIFPIKEEDQSFAVSMCSPIDQEVYLMEFKFDNYPEWPYYIEFIHPETKTRGATTAYPKGKLDSFFNKWQEQGIICHPCSRKSFAGYGDLHKEWALTGWQTIAGALINLKAILSTIYDRISHQQLYDGRLV